MGRRTRLTKIVVTVAGVAVLMTAASPATANHRPNSHCSESGDFCQSVKKVDGVRKLRLVLAARYFGRYELCVKAPDDTEKCGEFRIHEQGAVYVGSVRWLKHFPHKGPGAYTVTWFVKGDRLGKRLGFHPAS